MKISVIVPFLNEERYLGQCLAALEAQTFPRPDYEVICVDNGSSDCSVEIAKHHPQCLLLHERTRGAYAARNAALAVAQGEILAFTDGDCAPAQDWLEQIWKGMERTKALVVLGKRQLPSRSSWICRVVEDYENTKSQYLLREGPARCIFAYTNNMAIRRDVMRTIGMFAPWRLSEDVEYIQRCLARFSRDRVVYLDDMVVVHLELNRLRVWLTKQWVYGKGLSRLERETTYRILGNSQRLLVYRKCRDLYQYGLWQKATLCYALLIGVLSFRMGQLTDMFEMSR